MDVHIYPCRPFLLIATLVFAMLMRMVVGLLFALAGGRLTSAVRTIGTRQTEAGILNWLLEEFSPAFLRAEAVLLPVVLRNVRCVLACLHPAYGVINLLGLLGNCQSA